MPCSNPLDTRVNRLMSKEGCIWHGSLSVKVLVEPLVQMFIDKCQKRNWMATSLKKNQVCLQATYARKLQNVVGICKKSK